MASVLLRLASGSVAGVAESTQVIYTTHGPLFVGLDRFDQIRVLRKVTGGSGAPKITAVVQNPLRNVADRLWELHGRPTSRFTPETLQTPVAGHDDPLDERRLFRRYGGACRG